jgi:very-short-patch-repair endonuclease
LTQYSALINKVIEPFGATVFEILWARDRSGQDVASLTNTLRLVTLPAAAQFNRTRFSQVEQFLSIYARHLTAALGPSNSIDRHPWAWIEKPLQFEEEDQVLCLLSEFVSVIREYDKQCGQLHDIAGISLACDRRGFQQAASMLALLPPSEDEIIAALLPSCQSPANNQELENFIGHVESFHSAFDKVSVVTSDAAALLDSQIAGNLATAVECLRQWGLEKYPLVGIKQLLNTTTEAAKLLGEAGASFRTLLSATGCDAPVTLASVLFLLETVRIVETAPFDLLHLRLPAFEQECAEPTLQTAQQEASMLRAAEISLGAEFNLAAIPGHHTSDELLQHAIVLAAAPWWSRLFGAGYREGVKVYRRLARGGAKAPHGQMSAALRNIAEHLQSEARFNGNAIYREIFGIHFRGVESQWQGLNTISLWYKQVFVGLPQHQVHCEPFRRLVFTARVEHLKAVKANLNSTREFRESLQQVVSRIENWVRAIPSQRSLMLSGSLDEIITGLQNLGSELGAAMESFERASINGNVLAQDVRNILPVATQCRSAISAVESGADARALIGAGYKGVYTGIAPIRATLQFARSISAGGLPSTAAEWLLHQEYASRLAELRAWLGDVKECAAKLHSLPGQLAALSGAASWGDLADGSWGSLHARAQFALQNREELTSWNHFLRVRVKSKESGLDRLTALADAGALQSHEICPAFRFAFYNTLARSIFTGHAELSQVTGLTQEQLQHQFAAADREAIRLYRERAAAAIDQRPVPLGIRSGPIGSWTDMALIQHEIGKQTRHIPIRQLIQRSAEALLALKPCFMMGPLSVAQYLAPGQLKFDLVVMDEASQLRPEDAIGSLARAAQIVIVGDPKQLPPTSFFQRVTLDPEDDIAGDDRSAVEDGESILDVASTMFQPVRRLRWHYRSRHHSLIAFSNNEFYERDLIIFPSAYHDHPSLGVKHRFVPDGIFEGRRNAREAQVVAEAVLQHMRQHPDESLGVVTLNFDQCELIEELLDKQLRDDPVASAYQEKMAGGQEKLFIKNLENVQGDERDVIFISTTYGPDARGNQYQRFGPINGPQGHRRLNVLFTRSKKRIVVFTSLDPDRIQTSNNSSWGVRALKQYLIFARTGILQQADDGVEQAANDFECSVGAVLKENGHEVVPQVGVAGFFIDLGVKHPSKPGSFLLGIECDGASYHSARSARDRDRLRQEILENLGWKMYRIWSTDWFKSRDSESKKLLAHIKVLLENDRPVESCLQM